MSCICEMSCNTLPHTAAPLLQSISTVSLEEDHSTLQHTATHCNRGGGNQKWRICVALWGRKLQHAATHFSRGGKQRWHICVALQCRGAPCDVTNMSRWDMWISHVSHPEDDKRDGASADTARWLTSDVWTSYLQTRLLWFISYSQVKNTFNPVFGTLGNVHFHDYGFCMKG